MSGSSNRLCPRSSMSRKDPSEFRIRTSSAGARQQTPLTVKAEADVLSVVLNGHGHTIRFDGPLREVVVQGLWNDRAFCAQIERSHLRSSVRGWRSHYPALIAPTENLSSTHSEISKDQANRQM